MLGALEALNGIVLLGLSTAFLFSILHGAVQFTQSTSETTRGEQRVDAPTIARHSRK